jgi:hypothetical protein
VRQTDLVAIAAEVEDVFEPPGQLKTSVGGENFAGLPSTGRFQLADVRPVGIGRPAVAELLNTDPEFQGNLQMWRLQLQATGKGGQAGGATAPPLKSGLAVRAGQFSGAGSD